VLPSYSGDLDPNETTHLVVASPFGDKYDFASRPEHADKIAIVRAQWLLDCEERGELLDTNAYKFTRKKFRYVKEEDDDDHDIGEVRSLSVGEAMDKLLSSDMDTGRRSFPSPLFSRCQFCLLGFDGQNSLAARKRGSRSKNDNGGDGECAQLKRKLSKLIRRERGTILWELSDQVTHLVVADDCGDSIRRAAVSFALQLQGPLVVAPRWIVASCSAQRLLPPSRYLPKARDEEIMAPKVAAANSRVVKTAGDGDEGVGIDSEQTGRQSRRSSLSLSQQIRSSLFKGALFAFVRPTPPEWAVDWMTKSEFENCIAAHGGCMLTQPILSALRKSAAAASNTEDDYSRMGFVTRSRSGAPLTDRVCYIVSSGGYPQDQNAAFHPLLGDLMKENLCKVISVTPLWIKTSIAENRDVDASHFPYLFQPQLHHMARLPSSVHITVAVSGFVGGERVGIRLLLEAIGATYTDNMSKRNTHLISKTTCGPKYTKALEWGIKVVNIDWLCHITMHGYSGDGGGGGRGDNGAGDETRGCEVRFSLSDPKASQADNLSQALIAPQEQAGAAGQKVSPTQETISASYAMEASGKDSTRHDQQESKIPPKPSSSPSSIAAKKRSPDEMGVSLIASTDLKKKKHKEDQPFPQSLPQTSADGGRAAKIASPGEHKADTPGTSNSDLVSVAASKMKTGSEVKPRDSRVSRSLVGLDEGVRPMVARAGRRRRGPRGAGRGSRDSFTPKEEKASEDHDVSSKDTEPSDVKSPEMSSPSSNQEQAPDLGAESQMIWYEGDFTQY